MRRVDIVCTISTLCNLRCRYCDQYELLGDKQRMSIEQIERLFEHVNAHYQKADAPAHIHFQWYGGEPLLVQPEVYHQIFAAQQRVFGGSHHQITNGVQSNFTVIDDDRIALLRDCFDNVGASLDLFGDLRVNRRGMPQEAKAIANLDRVRAAGIRVNGITVLSRSNLDRIAEIYDFYRCRGMAFRMLPLERGLYPPGQDFEVRPRETLTALCALADLWLADPDLLFVEPLSRVFPFVLLARQHAENRVSFYDKAGWPSVLIVNRDGALTSYGERSDPACVVGNLFDEPLGDLIGNARYAASVERSARRMKEVCTGCRYYGRACSGAPVAEGGQEFADRDEDGRLRCTVMHGLIRHLEQRLDSGTVLSGRFLEAPRILGFLA